MSNIEKRLQTIEKKLDLLLNLKYGASQSPSDKSQGSKKKTPVKRQTKESKVVDLETLYRKRGII